MPNLDGGHYFLTVLAPIDNTGVVERDGAARSPVHMVREALETLPTALQSPMTEITGINSPFSRNTRTHLARFFVLDAPFFNGRNPADSLVTAISGTDLLSPQAADRLPCPYLVFVADFDPDAFGAEEPRAYLEALWDVAPRELTAVFEFCFGWDAVVDRASFARFIIANQVETTMPFNDYWVGAPPLPSLWMGWLGLPLLVAAGLAIWIAVALGWPWYGGLGLAIVLLLAAIVFDYGLLMHRGNQPFPAAPNATLPHVLKALYLQQTFTQFVIDHQGADPSALKAAFAAFVDTSKPEDLAGPTQAPGVVKTHVG